MNALFSCGDAVVRVGRPTAEPTVAVDLAQVLHRAGIRAATPVRSDAVVDGGLAATAWEHVRASATPTDWQTVGEMVRRLHDLPPIDVPAGYPLSAPTRFGWWDFDRLLAETGDALAAPELADARAGLVAAIERHRGWANFAESVVCHGDVHPGNVLQSADGPVLLDWDLLCRAPRSWDHAPMLTWASRWGGRPGEYEAFAAGYGWSARDDPEALAFAELRLVAATLMRVRAGRTDATARAEAERRLRFWAGDPDAPAWVAQ
jgi:Ser/Thr protein kinase RdoA (MazF antagonist)